MSAYADKRWMVIYRDRFVAFEDPQEWADHDDEFYWYSYRDKAEFIEVHGGWDEVAADEIGSLPDNVELVECNGQVLQVATAAPSAAQHAIEWLEIERDILVFDDEEDLVAWAHEPAHYAFVATVHEAVGMPPEDCAQCQEPVVARLMPARNDRWIPGRRGRRASRH